eukprot:8484544-Alexandrium_andersonii.AAC.1
MVDPTDRLPALRCAPRSLMSQTTGSVTPWSKVWCLSLALIPAEGESVRHFCTETRAPKS